MKIINLTPHAINLPDRTIEPSGIIPRCQEVSNPAGFFDGIELVNKSYGEVSDMPAPESETLYIVSFMVRAACPDRNDLASPGDLIRNEAGQVIGCKNLVVSR